MWFIKSIYLSYLAITVEVQGTLDKISVLVNRYSYFAYVHNASAQKSLFCFSTFASFSLHKKDSLACFIIYKKAALPCPVFVDFCICVPNTHHFTGVTVCSDSCTHFSVLLPFSFTWQL